MTQVRDSMQKNVITIEQDRTSLDAATILKEKEISFLVIIENEKPIAIAANFQIPVQKILYDNQRKWGTDLKTNSKHADFDWFEYKEIKTSEAIDITKYQFQIK